MICPKCGREIPDGTVCPCSAGASALSSNPALNVLKSIGSSPLFLTAAILYSVTVVINLIVSIAGGGNSGSTYFNMSYSAGEMYSSKFSVGTEVLGVLTALGMWLHYATCRNRQTGNISTAGLTVCKVMQIIQLVVTCLLCLLLLVAGVLLVVGADSIMDYVGYALFAEFGSTVDGSAVLIALGVGLIVGVLIAFPLAICYLVGVIRIINRMKATANTGMADNRVSHFVTGMNYLGAVFGVIGGFGVLFSYSRSVFSAVALFCSAAALILISVCLNQYRRQMTMVIYPAVQPPLTMPPAQGFAPYGQPVQNTYYTPQQGTPAQPVAPAQPAAPAPEEQATEAPAEETPKE